MGRREPKQRRRKRPAPRGVARRGAAANPALADMVEHRDAAELAEHGLEDALIQERVRPSEADLMRQVALLLKYLKDLQERGVARGERRARGTLVVSSANDADSDT